MAPHSSLDQEAPSLAFETPQGSGSFFSLPCPSAMPKALHTAPTIGLACTFMLQGPIQVLVL